MSTKSQLARMMRPSTRGEQISDSAEAGALVLRVGEDGKIEPS